MSEAINSSDNGRMAAYTNGKRRYWERKNSHLCTLCGKANDTGGACCPECRAKESERGRKNRQFYAELGLCHKCGKNRVFGSEKRCPECRAKVSAYEAGRIRTDREREKDNSRRRRRYQESREQGICVGCYKLKAVPGKTRCGICAEKERRRERQRYVPAAIPRAERNLYGLCHTCSNRLDMDGMKICSKCYADLKKAREAKAPSHWRRDNRMTFRSRQGYSCDPLTENAKRIFRTAPYAGAFMK